MTRNPVRPATAALNRVASRRRLCDLDNMRDKGSNGFESTFILVLTFLAEWIRIHRNDATEGRPTLTSTPFSLLMHLVGDARQAELFSPAEAVESWLAAERALALAQAELGIISQDDAQAIARAAVPSNIDPERLWSSARNVGYPILGVVREIAAALPEGANGRVHYGATTQDIMDTGLALQLQRSLKLLDDDLEALGNRLAEQVLAHSSTLMAGRTHAQQAVPTTFGATLATVLNQFTRQRQRVAQALPRIAVISMFGAGGTSAAYGPQSAALRTRVAEILGLEDTEVPWHVERDSLAEFGWLCVTITASCAKFARNIVDLSRTEIAEVFEPYSPHRGASSTMPQKVNPISSELIIGLSGTAGALASSLARIQEAGHERSAGEWQIEWQVIPQLASLAGSALRETLVIVDGMRVDADRMRHNIGTRRRTGPRRSPNDPAGRAGRARKGPRSPLRRINACPRHRHRARRRAPVPSPPNRVCPTCSRNPWSRPGLPRRSRIHLQDCGEPLALQRTLAAACPPIAELAAAADGAEGDPA